MTRIHTHSRCECSIRVTPLAMPSGCKPCVYGVAIFARAHRDQRPSRCFDHGNALLRVKRLVAWDAEFIPYGHMANPIWRRNAGVMTISSSWYYHIYYYCETPPRSAKTRHTHRSVPGLFGCEVYWSVTGNRLFPVIILYTPPPPLPCPPPRGEL